MEDYIPQTSMEARSGAVVSSTSIHLLITDVVMPEMGGKLLAEQLAEHIPGLKVLFISGYTDVAMLHHGKLNDGMDFLQKPFTPAALAQKVRTVLDG
jgi:two-component system cell cycle sensor histidine kinase/response regulator CckA